MRKSLVLALMLTVGSAAPAAGQSYYQPPLFRPATPPGPRVELDQVRAEVKWIDYLLGRVSKGDLLMSTGSRPDGGEIIVPVSMAELQESLRRAVAAGVMRPGTEPTTLAYWGAAARGNADKLRGRRAELVRREAQLVALTRSPTPPALQPWELGRPPAASNACVAQGVWSNTISAGSSTWTISADGTAVESGMGNARGKAVMSGDTLKITWRTGAVAGVYEIDVFVDCSGGDGTVSFTDGPPGFDRSPQASEFTRLSGPPAGGYQVEEGPQVGGQRKD